MGEVTARYLELPYPPSINHYWRRVGFKTLISKRGREYRKAVAKILADEGFEEISSPVELKITLLMPDRRKRDIDNVLKALLDSLQTDSSGKHGGALKDDNQVVKLSIEKGSVLRGGRVLLEIVER